MTTEKNNNRSVEDLMVEVLEQLLAEDEEITARAVARLHPSLKAASSITRNPARVALLVKYQEQQATYRRWRSRTSRMSGAEQSAILASKDARIAELEATVQLLTGSHVAMLRVVGELGGFSKWTKFYGDYSSVRDKLYALGAIPSPTVYKLTSHSPKSFDE